jgi:hypothetical protein
MLGINRKWSQTRVAAWSELAGRQDLMMAMKLAAAEHAVEELLMAVRKLRANGGPDGPSGASG